MAGTQVAQAAFDDALRYAQQRETFVVPIWKHQVVGGCWPAWRLGSPRPGS